MRGGSPVPLTSLILSGLLVVALIVCVHAVLPPTPPTVIVVDQGSRPNAPWSDGPPVRSPMDTASFHQVGMAKPQDDTQPVILSLMGRRTGTKAGYWQYYCVQNNGGPQLPVLVQNQQGMNDTGVPELSTGDTIFVQGYDKPYVVNIYQLSFAYMPDIY